ncbi:MAG: hypothetical protein KF729_28915 [Sandaracinaceae bacterium]|nr:hypothetical protein [Sandaracinaceae bacterium]
MSGDDAAGGPSRLGPGSPEAPASPIDAARAAEGASGGHDAPSRLGPGSPEAPASPIDAARAAEGASGGHEAPSRLGPGRSEDTSSSIDADRGGEQAAAAGPRGEPAALADVHDAEHEAFSALREKYAELRALRLLHAAGDPEDPRPRLRALAARFPGALRELDALPFDEIERRIAALDAGERPRWARTLVAYHGWMRLALRVRAACDRDASAAQVRARLAQEPAGAAGDPPLEVLEDAEIAEILRPPGGRLTRWALARIARARGVSAEVVAAEAFPSGKD